MIVENTGALAFYEKLGYRTVRDVEVWSLPGEASGEATAREVSAPEAYARIRELRSGREPWQRADETLAHLSETRGLVTGTGATVFRSGTGVHVVQLAGEGEPLFRELRRQGTVSVVNLPADDPATRALRTLDAKAVVRQHEMLFEL